jgi:RNA polymerase-binding transcription factor DksA
MAKATPNQKPAAAKTATTKSASAPARTPTAAKKPASAKGVAPAKKAAPARKTAPAKKAAPARKAAPAKKVASAKKAAPAKKAPAKKPAPVVKAAKAAKAVEKAPKAVEKAAKVAKVEKEALAKKAVGKRSTTVICPLSGFEVKPEKPNLSAKALERLEALLREERARHVAQADTMAAEAEQLAAEREGGDTQFDEESGEGDTINIERERDLLLSASANQIVEEIDRALERIAAGTYGVCVPAGRRISLERLEALPYADTCVDCKARAERRR